MDADALLVIVKDFFGPCVKAAVLRGDFPGAAIDRHGRLVRCIENHIDNKSNLGDFEIKIFPCLINMHTEDLHDYIIDACESDELPIPTYYRGEIGAVIG